ncbi:MAG TPA: hypothetical protein VFS43_41385 [Polyangiaceae bacterium]|nr:hypothetical protein [Polyangiaceae bacterium]
MFGRRAAVSLVCLALTLAAPARGAGPAEEAYAEAQGAERALDFARALSAYRRAFELDPSGPVAAAARTRAEALGSMSEGGFGPLRALEALRRDPARLGSPAALEAFAREAEAFPAGPVRDEARLLAAEALVRRLDAPAAGAALARSVAEDASASPAARAQAAGLAVEVAAALEGDAGAARLARRYGALVPGAALRHERRVWWRRGRAAALAALGVLAAAALAAAVRAGRGALRGYASARVPALLVGALIAGGAGLASWQSPGASPGPFLGLAAGVVAVDAGVALVRRAWAGAAWGRPLALALGLLGVVAAAYLALAWRDPLYLESLFGWS